MDKATPTPASVESVMAKAMMLVGALGDSCEAATSLPFLEAVTALRAEVERLAAQAAPSSAIIASLCGDVEPVAWVREVLLSSGAYSPPRKELAVSFTRHTDADRPLYSAAAVAVLKATIAELEKDGPMVEVGKTGAGTPAMVTMRKAWGIAQMAATAEAGFADEFKAQRDAALARVAELEKDAARLEFVCNSPNRMVERENGLWRVYEDVAPTDRPTAVWQGITPRWHVTPREAIDAAITAALTKGQPAPQPQQEQSK